MSLFYPTMYRRRVTDVTLADLRRLGAGAILLDIDNTLTTHDAPDLSPEVAAWLERMRGAGIAMTVVSNNREERVRPFAEKIGLHFQARAGKPLSRGYRAAAARLSCSPAECVAVGDQIFTDILGANLAGMPSILLEPIQPERDQKLIVFKRFWERLLLRSRRQRQRKEEDYRG